MTTELWYCIAAGSIVAATLLCLTASSIPAIMQQSGYSGEGFLEWYYERGNMILGRHMLLALCLFLLTALFNLCFSFLDVKWANLISLAPFAGMCILFRFSDRRALKVPVKRTGRLMRVCGVYWFLLVAVIFGVCVGFTYGAREITGLANYFRYVIIAAMPFFFPALFALANNIVKIYDVPRNKRFEKRAAKILAESPCIKVGITGSFGKTSVKNMAKAILSEKYKVIATGASFNTPIGIARTVNEIGLDCDIFIAEMGARRVGDIKELCKMVNPQYGIITGICAQHLETFGSLENIIKEKGVLANYAKKVVLGKSAAVIPAEEKLAEGEDFAVEDISLRTDGTGFTLRFKEEKIEVKTELLGRAAAEDIALAAALAYQLGMSAEEIKIGIEKIEPVPHRLEKFEANGVTILDDSYNCNEEGAKCAVEVLKLFEGNKWVVTPGIVELGILETEKNEALGASFVGLEQVVLVGETLVQTVKKGYLAAGGDKEKIRTVPTLKDAQELLAKELATGDTVLFLNDLPDIYVT